MTDLLEAKAPACPPKRSRAWLLPLAYGTGMLLALWLFRDVWFHRTQSFLCNWDASVQSYAWHAANITTLKQGAIRLWDFTTSSGTSFIGEIQPGPLYPVTWLFALLPDALNPDWLEWKLILHFSLAFGSFVLLVRHNGLSWGASLAGAACFAFGGSVAARAPGQPNIFEGLVHLPLVLYGCQRAIESTERPWRNAWIGGAAAATALMVLAGHMQPAVHAGFAVFLLTLALSWRNPRLLAGRMGTLALVGIGVAMLTGPQIAALLEYMAHAYRWIGAPEPTRPPHRIPYEVYGFDHVIKWADLPGLWNMAHPSKDGASLYLTKTGIGLAFASLLLWRQTIIRYALGLAALAFLISMGDGSWPGKAAYHLPLLGSIREPSRALCLFHLGAAILVAGGVDALMRLAGQRTAVKGVLLAVAGVLLLAELSEYARTLILPRTLPMHPTGYYSDVWERELAQHTLHEPGGPYRYMALPNELLPPNLGNSSGALSTRGHRATMQMDYRHFLDRNWDPAGDIFRRLGLRYVVSREPVAGFSKVTEHEGLGLWERSDAVGVFHFAGPTGPVNAPIGAVRWLANSVEIEVKTHPAARLVFAQVPYPGWKAEVNGRKANLLNHDGLLAVDLGEGTSRVTFAYRPGWLFPLSGLAVVGAILVIAGFTRQFRTS